MLPRITLGAIVGYAIGVVAFAIALSGQTTAASYMLLKLMLFSSQKFAMDTGISGLLIPTLLGALAGYCWHKA